MKLAVLAVLTAHRSPAGSVRSIVRASPAAGRLRTFPPRACSGSQSYYSPKRVQGEVVWNVPPPPPPPVQNALSEDAVQRILELVWRDSRMVLRTALMRPLPVVMELAQDRLPLARWYATYKADQAALWLNEQLAVSRPFAAMAPAAAAAAPREVVRLERRLEVSRSTLWPTLRALLLRPSTHQRMVRAAREQVAQFKAAESSLSRLLRTPRRVMLLTAGLLRSLSYTLKWVVIELVRRAPPGSGTVGARVASWRNRLIERGIRYGLELQRRVEQIEDARRWRPPPRSLAVPAPAAPPLSATGIASAAALEGTVLLPPAAGGSRPSGQGARTRRRFFGW